MNVPHSQQSSRIAAAKQALDATIDNARGQAYKAVHVAEILHHDRTRQGEIFLHEHESFRSASKRWRDDVCERLIGASSRSNGVWQDNLFTRAATPETLTVLGTENRRLGGVVEAYIFRRLGAMYSAIGGVIAECETTAPESFSLSTFLDRCRSFKLLSRVVERVFEIVAWAVIDTLVEAVGVEVTVRVRADPVEKLAVDDLFRTIVLGLPAGSVTADAHARVDRLGVCNAGDGRLDLVSDFRFKAQVKHATLTAKLAEKIARETPIDGTTIVCRDVDRSYIGTCGDKSAPGSAIQGVITEADLIRWSNQIVARDFGHAAGHALLRRIVTGLRREFPAVRGDAFAAFMRERDYDRLPVWTA